jgi:glycine cleavage system pyridoxal-binding protein P
MTLLTQNTSRRSTEIAAAATKETTVRYLPLTPEDREDMLARIGADNIDALFASVPADKLL